MRGLDNIVAFLNVQNPDAGPMWIPAQPLNDLRAIHASAPLLTPVNQNVTTMSREIPVPDSLHSAPLIRQAIQSRRYLYTEDNDVRVVKREFGLE